MRNPFAPKPLEVDEIEEVEVPDDGRPNPIAEVPNDA